MAVDVKNLIAAINPDLYCDNIPDVRGKILCEEVKKIVKEKGDYLKAAEIAKLKEPSYIDVEYSTFEKAAFDKEGLKRPIEQHKIVYDASSQTLEEVYFWILDFVQRMYGKTDKLVDNFISSTGSGHFGEMQQRATVMQKEGMNIFGTINGVIRSIINIIYDLKEFKIRLGQYDDYESGNEIKKQAALLALKQIWIDNVDIKRGVGSINGLAQQLDFVTLRDAFMAVESLPKVEELDLNERVKRILKQRVTEFDKWVEESGKELRKRFEIEKSYLRSQINSVKLYSRWAKPYLKAARQLEQNMKPSADIVTAFNTAVFELVLLAEGKYDIKQDIDKGELPKEFDKIKARKYSPVALIEFRFRSIPERSDQRGGYSFRGKVEVMFTSFALNEDELKVLRDEIGKSDFADVYELIEGATEKSFGELEKDIDDLLGEKKKDEKKKINEEDANPFSSLFSFFKKEDNEEKKDFSKGIPKDNYYEQVFRSQAILSARTMCRKVYDNYKKVHGMPTFPETIGALWRMD